MTMTEITVALLCYSFAAITALLWFAGWSLHHTTKELLTQMTQQRQANVEAMNQLVAMKSPEASRASAAATQEGLASTVAGMLERQTHGGLFEDELAGL